MGLSGFMGTRRARSRSGQGKAGRRDRVHLKKTDITGGSQASASLLVPPPSPAPRHPSQQVR